MSTAYFNVRNERSRTTPDLSDENFASALAYDLHGMNQPAMIIDISHCQIPGSDTRNSSRRALQTSVIIEFQHIATHIIGYGRQIVKATHHSVNIHHGAATHHRIAVATRLKTPDKSQHVRFKTRGAIIFTQIKTPDKMVPDGFKLAF